MEENGSTIIVACDESGNDGENLFAGSATVFAHGSVSISKEDASLIMAELRERTRYGSNELKSRILLKERNLEAAQWLLSHERIQGSARVHITEKRFFLTAKLFDATVEENMHARGVDIFSNGIAWKCSQYLYEVAPQEFGGAWDCLLEKFNSTLRKDAPVEALSEAFGVYEHLTELMDLSSDDLLSYILRETLSGMAHLPLLIAQQTGHAGPRKLRTLDPALSAIGQTARSWGEDTGKAVIILHDDAKVLELPGIIDEFRYHLKNPDQISPMISRKGVTIIDIQQATSTEDARIQIADLLAGIGRRVAEEALKGTEHDLLAGIAPMLDPSSIWGDGDSWSILNKFPSD